MKVTMVIPTYWSREVGWVPGDVVYDHPNPLDGDGTLLRTIKSLELLNDTDFQLVVIAAATSRDIELQVEKKIGEILSSIDRQSVLFGPSKLNQIHDLMINRGKNEYVPLLQLRGYSNIRNLCLFIPHIMGSDAAICIDDDEVFEDPGFVSKAREYIGKNMHNKCIQAVAGYYLQPDGDYRINKVQHPWMQYWDQYTRMNEAFDAIIGTEPRLKETPFVLGGNMIIHRDLFCVVPFDPGVSRGEDIDYLINARMFGFRFCLDNRLSIKHLPPEKMHPVWKQLREDIYRFVYERAKLEHQKDVHGMTRVDPGDLDPYPGSFLRADLDDKIHRSCTLLAAEYRAQGDQEGYEESLNNIILSRTDTVPKNDPFQDLCNLQQKWQELMEYTGGEDIGSEIRYIIEEG